MDADPLTSFLDPLAGKRIVLGVTGGIAAYKAALLVRLLKTARAEVQVVMTPDAARFVTPLTLGTLSEREVLIEVWPETSEASWTKHVELGLWADLFCIAPATAQTVAKLASGFCDNMLTAVALSARCPILVCPAMDCDMYAHPATQRNLSRLREMGYAVMDADSGPLASGLVGVGRLPEPESIAGRIRERLQPDRRMAGQRVLVTAGPTREFFDPVRFLSNPSTGTMGFALAAEAARRGATVTLVAGPVALETPPGVARVDVTRADEMHAAVQHHAPTADLVVMTAAVADYAPAETHAHKQKKGDGDLTLALRRTPDILAELGTQKKPGQTLVGFAMETQDGSEHAMEKLRRKNLDCIVLNVLGEPGAGFGPGTNRVTVLYADGHEDALPLLPKPDVARLLLDRFAALRKDGAAVEGVRQAP